MDFISNQKPQIEEMLALIGIHSIEDLFESVPAQLQLKPPLQPLERLSACIREANDGIEAATALVSPLENL